MKISKILLIAVLFIAFFEIGLFSSYTIVTSEVPNIQDLIDLQINTVTSIFSPDQVGNLLIKNPTEINITNKNDVANALTNKSNVDGVDVDNMTITTTNDTKKDSNFTLNITTYGYSAPSTSSGEIVLSQQPDYKIIASARGNSTGGGITVDLSSIKIDSILKVYNNGSSSSESLNAAANSNNSSNKSLSSKYSNSSSSSYDSGMSSSDASSTSNFVLPLFKEISIFN